MSDWMGSTITLGFASVVIGMLAGRVCTWGACCYLHSSSANGSGMHGNCWGWIQRNIPTFNRPEPLRE